MTTTMLQEKPADVSNHISRQLPPREKAVTQFPSYYTQDSLKFEIAVSRMATGKDGYNQNKYQFGNSFHTEQHDLDSLIDLLTVEGYPVCAVHKREAPKAEALARGVSTYRHTENFVSQQVILLDDDQAIPGVVQSWLDDPFFSQYGAAFYESASSKPLAEKGRPFFILDRPIYDPAEVKEILKAFAFRYPQIDQGVHDAIRVWYGAPDTRAHRIGHTLPYEVLEAEVLTPYRLALAEQEHQKEQEQTKRLAEYELAKEQDRIRDDSEAVDRYLDATLTGIFDFVADQAHGRHKAILWAGVKVGELESAGWTDSRLFTDAEIRIVKAAATNGYLADYANGNENEVLRTFNDGRAYGHMSPAPFPMLYDRPGYVSQAKPAPGASQPGPKELERLAQKERCLAEAADRKETKQAQKEAKQAEVERRWNAGNVANFIADEEIDPDEVEYKRGLFKDSRKWADYCKEHYPDLDPDEQRKIKAAENREARPGTCGNWRKITLGNGQVVSTRWGCGLCDNCRKYQVQLIRRALNNIQGTMPERGGREILSLDELQADDLESKEGDAPRENAPELPQVKGDLSWLTIGDDKERLELMKELRDGQINYKCYPYPIDNEMRYDFIVNDDRGDPLGLITDERIALWVKGAEGKKASGLRPKKVEGKKPFGPLIPGLKDLQKRYRQALPFEIVCPELDDEGQPVDPDILTLELPDIGTEAALPAIEVSFDVHDAASLQAALNEIHIEQSKILGRRGAVTNGVYVKRYFYTRFSWLPQMIDEFNARQELIKQKKRKN